MKQRLRSVYPATLHPWYRSAVPVRMAVSETPGSRDEGDLSHSPRAELVAMLAATVLCYFTLYGPQPLLPLFRGRYELSTAGAGLIVTVAMLPLTLGPVVAGMLLSIVNPRRLMGVALLVLSVAIGGFLVADRYEVVLAARLAQGLTFPLILTAVTAQVAMTSPPGSVGRRLGYYVAATIVGGFGGRLLASVSAAIGDWRLFFAGVAVCALLLGLWSAFCGSVVTPSRPASATRLEVRDTGRSTSAMPRIFAGVFLLFLVFSGTLNVLPFRIVRIAGARSEWLTGVIYAGYVMGIATSIWSHRIARAVGGSARALGLAFSLMAMSIVLALAASVPLLFGSLFVFCGAMFLIHSISTGAANEAGAGREGATNGRYISAYYSGGVLGTYAAPLIYDAFGWTVLAALSIVLVTLAGALLVSVAAASSRHPRRTSF